MINLIMCNWEINEFAISSTLYRLYHVKKTDFDIIFFFECELL